MLRVIAILLLVASPAAATPPAASPPVPRDCDGQAHETEGDRRLSIGHFAAALHEYQRALQCKPTELRWIGAATAACKLYVVTKRTKLIEQAYRYIVNAPPAKQERLRQMCTGAR